MPQHVDRHAPLVLLNCAQFHDYACPGFLSGESKGGGGGGGGGEHLPPLGFGLPSLGYADTQLSKFYM